MKWNWGTKIVISFILFAAFIMYMVVQAFREDIDLVSENYYQEELDYQQHIENKSNLDESGFLIDIVQQGDNIIIKYPQAFRESAGKIYFYHPSRQLFDQTFEMSVDDKGQQVISTDKLVPGRFRIKMDWNIGGKSYYQEKEFYIQ